MFKKTSSSVFRPDKTRAACFFEHLQEHSTKSVSIGSPNKGSKCEGKILAYKKNKPGLIIILYIKNLMRMRGVLSFYRF